MELSSPNCRNAYKNIVLQLAVLNVLTFGNKQIRLNAVPECRSCMAIFVFLSRKTESACSFDMHTSSN